MKSILQYMKENFFYFFIRCILNLLIIMIAIYELSKEPSSIINFLTAIETGKINFIELVLFLLPIIIFFEIIFNMINLSYNKKDKNKKSK